MNFSGQKILLTAFSLNKESESQALVEYLKQHGADDITTLYWGGEEIASQIPVDVKKIEIAGVNDFDKSVAKDFDLVFRHTMTRPDLLEQAKTVTSSTIEFFKNCPAPIIGVTGTKGKGTTSTLSYKMLTEAGKTAHLVGNIGEPALRKLADIKPDDIVVFEMSSFQLWDLKQSPHTTVVLMLEPDHMDVHTDMKEYVDAKANIAKYQTDQDTVYYFADNEFSTEIAQQGAGKKVPFINEDLAYFDDSSLYFKGEIICALSEIGLLGKHNLQNICAALSAASDYIDNVDAMRRVVKEFKGLEFHLELVREINGVKYYNDSFSSAQTATVAAINSFSQPIVVIIGGKDKKVDLSTIADAVVSGNVKKAILIGETAEQLKQLLTERGFDNCEVTVQLMDRVVEIAANNAQPGNIVLLSPGSASFDQYKNFKERGKMFSDAVNNL